MDNDDLITFVAWHPPTDGPTFGCRSDYVEQCWTPLLGPGSILLLRLLATMSSSSWDDPRVARDVSEPAARR